MPLCNRPAQWDDAIGRLSSWDVPAMLVEDRDDYLRFLDDHGVAALDRDGGPAHLTASCFVFNLRLTHVLLCFHRKGQFWVQVGGHIDTTDETLVAAALREAREESGLTELSVVDGVLDLDRHRLSSAFGRCAMHWDVGFAVLSPRHTPQVSDESEQVAWFPVGALPEQLASSVSQRIDVMLGQLHRVQPRDPHVDGFRSA